VQAEGVLERVGFKAFVTWEQALPGGLARLEERTMFYPPTPLGALVKEVQALGSALTNCKITEFIPWRYRRMRCR